VGGGFGVYYHVVVVVVVVSDPRICFCKGLGMMVDVYVCYVMMCLSGLLGSQITRNNRAGFDIYIVYYDVSCTDIECQAVKSSVGRSASEGSQSSNRQQTS